MRMRRLSSGLRGFSSAGDEEPGLVQGTRPRSERMRAPGGLGAGFPCPVPLCLLQAAR